MHAQARVHLTINKLKIKRFKNGWQNRNPFLPHFCSFFLSTVAKKSHLKYDVVLHHNEQEFHHAEIIFLGNYLEKYFVWLELFDLQVVSHTFERSDFLQKKTALLNSHLLFRTIHLFFVDVVCEFPASISDSHCTRNENFDY